MNRLKNLQENIQTFPTVERIWLVEKLNELTK